MKKNTAIVIIILQIIIIIAYVYEKKLSLIELNLKAFLQAS